MRKILVIALFFVIFWIINPGLLFLLSVWLDRYFKFSALSNTVPLGVFMLSVSFPFLLWSILRFVRSGNELPVSLYPPRTIIHEGIYSIWRHPVYLFFSISLLGAGLLLKSLAFLIIVFPLYLLGIGIYIYFEEKKLLKRFGKTYINYRKKTNLLVPQLYVVTKLFAYAIFKILFKYQVVGLKNIPSKPPFIIISAHRNYLDPFFISLAVNFPVSYVTTYEVFRNKYLRYFLKKFNAIPKYRFKPDLIATRKVMELLETKSVVGIFPEGERSWTGIVSPFKIETLKLFKKYHNVPILPVMLEGNFHIWPRWADKMRNSKVKVTFKKPVYVNPADGLMKIEKNLKQLIIPSDIGIACKSKNYLKKLETVIYRCPICFTFKKMITIGDNELGCPVCKSCLLLLPDYSIRLKRDNKSFKFKLNELYNRIKIVTEDIHPKYNSKNQTTFADEKIILETEKIPGFYGSDDKLIPCGKGCLCLTNISVLHLKSRDVLRIPLQDIRSVTTESNCKLQIYEKNNESLHQFVFSNESVLKFYDYMLETMKTNFNLIPNIR